MILTFKIVITLVYLCLFLGEDMRGLQIIDLIFILLTAILLAKEKNSEQVG